LPKKSKRMVVTIDNLSFKAIIGILPFERKTKQKVIVDLSFEYMFHKDSDDFIDYSIVVNIIKKTMKKKRFLLIEDAIIYLENKLNSTFKISNLKLKITKPNILKDCIVGVSNCD